MKKFLCLLILLPELVFAQDLTTQINTNIRGKIYNPTSAGNMFKAIVDSIHLPVSLASPVHVTGILQADHGGTGTALAINGDMLSWNGTGWNLLNVGSNNQVLTVTGGLPRWGNAVLEPIENIQTTDYTLVASDRGKKIVFNSASARILTIPLNVTVAFPVPTIIYVESIGTGGVTIQITGGGTLNSNTNTFTLPGNNNGQYTIVAIEQRASVDNWVCYNGSPGRGTSGTTSITGNITDTGAFTYSMNLNGVSINQNAINGSNVPALYVQPGNSVNLVASSIFSPVHFKSYSLQWATGNFATELALFRIGAPTLTAVGSSTANFTSNVRIRRPVLSTNFAGATTPTPTTSTGSYALHVDGPLFVTDSVAGFTGGLALYQSASGSSVIAGGAANYSLTFGASGITPNCSIFGAGFFNTVFNSTNNAYRGNTPFTASSGTTAPAWFAASGSSINTTSTYSGIVAGFEMNQTATSTIGASVVGLHAKSGLTAGSGTSNYYGVYGDGTISGTGSHSGGKTAAVYWNLTYSNVVGVTPLFLIDPNATDFSGFGTITPVATIHNAGSSGWKTSTSAAGTLTLDKTATVWVFTGTTTTWTLPALSGNTDLTYILVNRGSGNLTLSRAGSDNIYTTSSVTSVTIAAGEKYLISNDGSFWLACKMN